MNLIDALILGLVQGLTEFIPVSSSGHLILFQEILGVTEAGLGFDVALHVGTVLALVVFFYRDIANLLSVLLKPLPQSRLVWLLVVATVPAIIAGVLLQGWAETSFRSTRLVAANLIFVGGLMLIAEWLATRSSHSVKLENVSIKQALAIGVAQAAAIVPGVSRSGSTITTGIFMGLDRVAATRFSFLLAIPITLGAIIKVAVSDNTLQAVQADTGIFLIGVTASFVSGLLAIRFLLNFLAKRTLRTFAYYRFVLGALVLLFL